MRKPFRKVVKNGVFRLVGGALQKAIKTDVVYRYGSLRLHIPNGVFHPRYFTSTRLLRNWVEREVNASMRVLELGCGSGIISLVAAQKGAEVVASDISSLAVLALQKNADQNKLSLKVVQSDLWDDITEKRFDVVLVNPPFYPKNPENEADKMWFCGEDFDYFHKFFRQLTERVPTEKVLMVLSDDCDLSAIREIGRKHGFLLVEKERKKGLSECNMLYQLERIHQRS